MIIINKKVIVEQNINYNGVIFNVGDDIDVILKNGEHAKGELKEVFEDAISLHSYYMSCEPYIYFEDVESIY